MSWQTTAHERLSDYKENAVKKMTASTIGSGNSGVVVAKKENAEEDGNVESLLLKNMAPAPSDDDDEKDAGPCLLGRLHRLPECQLQIPLSVWSCDRARRHKPNNFINEGYDIRG